MIRKLCNSGDSAKLREVIGIPSVADHIIKYNLFKDLPFTKDPKRFVGFKNIGLEYPRNKLERDSLFKLDSGVLSKIMQMAGLIESDDIVINHLMEPIGENGYSGQIMRVSGIELNNPDHFCKVKSFVIKTCFAP